MPCLTLTGEIERQGYFKVYINLIFDAGKILSDLNIKTTWIKILRKVLATERLTNIPVPLTPVSTLRLPTAPL